MARVLVVEDDQDIRDLVARRLQGAGHQVAPAASADEALAVVTERGAPELAVLDVGPPHVDGFELLARLRGVEGLGSCPRSPSPPG